MQKKILIARRRCTSRVASLSRMNIFNDQVICSHFIDGNINAATCSVFLNEHLDDLLKDISLAICQRMLFQQDGHPAHVSLMARAALNREYTGRWIGLHSPFQDWPPRSPDLTLIFILWDYLQDHVYRTLPTDRDDLVNRIRSANASITPAMLLRVQGRLMRSDIMC